MNRKGAIELSVNFIVVIVISSIILVAGLALFFNLKDKVTEYKDTIDGQTEDRLKSMMLNNNGRVAVYPAELKLSRNDAKMVGLGVQNIFTDERTFEISLSIKHYALDGTSLTVSNPNDYYTISPGNLNIPSGSQVVKGVLIKIPSDAEKGQYAYSIQVKTLDDGKIYDTVIVYVTV
jgi:hypothetical protein